MEKKKCFSVCFFFLVIRFVSFVSSSNPNSVLNEYKATLKIQSPLNHSVVTNPVRVRCGISVENIIQFQQKQQEIQVCLQLDDGKKECYDLSTTAMIFNNLKHGKHVIRATMLEKNQHISSYNGDAIEFTVGSKQDYEHFLLANNNSSFVFVHENHPTIYDWEVKHSSFNLPTDATNEMPGVDQNHFGTKLLVIGIKSSAEQGFPYRQAIRETWKKDAPSNILIFFVVGIIENNLELRKSLRAEKEYFKDVLIDEINTTDSYFNLVEKTKKFMVYALTVASFSYLMILDDDVYLKLDDLTQALLKIGNGKRFYAGQVWAKQYNRPVRPQRDSSSQNYLSIEEYPLSELPPFAIGPHYIISSDCVEFISQNAHMLRGVGTLEDVSVAMWLLPLQVYPEHVPWFANLKNQICFDGVVSLADLSPSAIRIIYNNLKTGKKFCHGYHEGWEKPNYTIKGNNHKTTSESDDNKNSGPSSSKDNSQSLLEKFTDGLLEVEAEIKIKKVPQVVLFSPIKQSLSAISMTLCEKFNINSTVECNSVFAQLKALAAKAIPNELSIVHTKLWNHNVKLSALPFLKKIIKLIISPFANYSKKLIECIFVDMFPECEILVVDFSEYRAQDESTNILNVVIFSALDGNCGSSWDQRCQLQAMKYLSYFDDTNCVFLMLCGEPWDLTPNINGFNLGKFSIIFLHTVKLLSISKISKHTVYLPVASTSFAERFNANPNILLHPSIRFSSPEKNKKYLNRKFCAYLYNRCDRFHRENMYNLLNGIESVDALGKCNGGNERNNAEILKTRFARWYNDEAVKVYSNYKFVISFENAISPGYVTEKIINAFLANSIPIYYGHSESVEKYFNPDSYIDCGKFHSLEECSLHVYHIHQSDEQYIKMLSQPRLTELGLRDLFSWHPNVNDTTFSENVRQHIISVTTKNGYTLK